MNKTKVLGVRLTEADLTALKKLADKLEVSVGYLIRQAIKKVLK